MVDMVYTCTNGYNGNLYLDAGDTMQFFASENDNNERHVLRKKTEERIELRQPVNVSRLYPSLPDLRDETINQNFEDRV